MLVYWERTIDSLESWSCCHSILFAPSREHAISFTTCNDHSGHRLLNSATQVWCCLTWHVPEILTHVTWKIKKIQKILVKETYLLQQHDQENIQSHLQAVMTTQGTDFSTLSPNSDVGWHDMSLKSLKGKLRRLERNSKSNRNITNEIQKSTF